ncbi:unnamed protein product [Caenorhabditis bovis]|uniref:Uncharacterized protein n=1 Tax=Caenorhabditis bovis TaxID=2654633 RepID=A0A8S1E486_9PELO|nr:unnamed protein product [Caenorhabditis bovis]
MCKPRSEAIWVIPRTNQWIPIYVDFDCYPNQRLLFTIYALTIIAILVGCSGIGAWQTVKFQRVSIIHCNLRFIYLSHFLTYQLYLIASLICILYEMHVIPRQHTYPGDLAPIMAGFIKLGYMLFGFHVISVIVVERLFATIYVRSYEKHKNVSLGVILVLGELIATAFFAVNFSYRHFSVYTGIGCVVFIGLPSFLIFIIIYTFNKKYRQSLKGHDDDVANYTLSTRYQIAENLYVFKMVFELVTISFIGHLISITLIYFYAITDISKDDVSNNPIFGFFLELDHAVYPVIVMWRLNHVENTKRQRLNSRVEPQCDRAQIYFNHLSSTWS